MARLCHFRFGQATQATSRARGLRVQLELGPLESRVVRPLVPGVGSDPQKPRLHQRQRRSTKSALGAEAANVPMRSPATRAEIHDSRAIQDLKAAIGYVERHKKLLGAESTTGVGCGKALFFIDE